MHDHGEAIAGVVPLTDKDRTPDETKEVGKKFAKSDIGFEAALMQSDTGCVLLPLLPEAFHPGFARLASLLVKIRPEVIEIRRSFREEFWLDFEGEENKPGVPGWDSLRRIGGELVEVFALAAEEEATRGRPLVIAGKFADGKLLQMTLAGKGTELDQFSGGEAMMHATLEFCVRRRRSRSWFEHLKNLSPSF